MSRVPLGKVLLRNVIRHTDAHNKGFSVEQPWPFWNSLCRPGWPRMYRDLPASTSQVLVLKVCTTSTWPDENFNVNQIQEESDMWKIRELEKQMEDAYQGTRRNTVPSSSSRMRSDGFDEESQRDYWRPKNEIPGALEDDFLKAKSWNKKLYDYESNMPDRWGHSGYKELYPEEFETDSSDQQDITNGKKTSPQVKASAHESRKRKKSKKSHKKKQKKRSHKKQKKNKKEAMDIAADSSSEFSEETGASSTRKRKQPHKSKKKSRKKSPKKSLPLGRESATSQSDDSAASSSEEMEERDTKKTKRKKKEKSAHVPVANPDVQERTSKRRNWKVATDARSAESSEDD